MTYDYLKFSIGNPEDFYSWKIDSFHWKNLNYKDFYLDKFPFMTYGSIAFLQDPYVEVNPFKYCAAHLDGSLVFGHGNIPLLSLQPMSIKNTGPQNTSFIYNHTGASIDEVGIL